MLLSSATTKIVAEAQKVVDAQSIVIVDINIINDD
jgi:hypothetical protein